MTTKPLRAVAEDERVVPAVPPKTVTQAASHGTELELWVAMRDRVALQVESETTSPRDLAALTKRLGDIVHEIQAIRAREAKNTRTGKASDEAFDGQAV